MSQLGIAPATLPLALESSLKPLEVQVQAVQLQGNERAFDGDLEPQHSRPVGAAEGVAMQQALSINRILHAISFVQHSATLGSSCRACMSSPTDGRWARFTTHHVACEI